MTRKRLHLVFGSVLLVFIITHLINHLALAAGAEAHIALMDRLRVVYRHPFIEGLLLGGIIAQLYLGLRLALKRGRPRSAWGWAQVLSGGYLLVFLAQHVPAVFWGRLVGGLDTNIYFAAATVDAAPALYYFAPYYVLAVTAVFTHLGAALHFRSYPRVRLWLWGFPLAGCALGVWIVLQMAGLDVPAPYVKG